MYVKPVSAVLPAAIILPNTGSNKVMAVIALASVIVGVVAIATSLGSAIAKKANKA